MINWIKNLFNVNADRVPKEVTRLQRLERLEGYFLRVLCEDPIEGSNFDCEILDILKELKNKYKNDYTIHPDYIPFKDMK